MKKIQYLFISLLFLSLMTLVAACGNPSTGSSTTTQSPSTHDATPNGHGSAGQGQSSKTEVTIKLTEFAIETSLKTFTPGATYRFVITNTGKATHEFMITPKSLGPMPDMDMDKMHDMVLAHLENIEPGQTKTLDYTFPDTTKGSRPEFVCYLPGHYETGMKQEVSVQ